MRYRGPISDHFDGKRFHNQENPDPRGFADFVHWMRHREPGPWVEWSSRAPGPPPPRQVTGGRMRVTFVNHSTVLVQMDGVNVLTDPVWRERIGPVSWAGPRRHRPPGVRLDDLPAIDFILLSHNHYDHLDRVSLRRLVEAHRPRLVVPLANRACVASAPVAAELDWWQSAEFPGKMASLGTLRVTSVPARHFSGRSPLDRNAALWCGYVFEAPSGAAYFAGDTGWGQHFAQVAERFGPIRLALLPIGAYKPRWFMSPFHTSPEEAVRAHQILKPATSVAIHFGTFRLADDGQDEPAADLAQALDRAGILRERFWVLENGEGRDVPEDSRWQTADGRQ